MEEVQQWTEAEGEKDDVDASNIAVDTNGNSESDEQKSRADIWRATGPRRSSRGNWTEEEDKVLQAAVQRFNGKCWKKIAECVPNRTDVQCLHRWQKVLNPDLVKGPWTKEEDDRIVELVSKHDSRKWSKLAKHLPGRIGKQCRERWHNHLNPDIKKNPWSREEESILIEAQSKYGNKWAEIAKLLHGRSENSIKNHWNCSLKKKLEQNLSRSGDDRSAVTTPIIPRGSKVETGNGEESGVKQNRGTSLFMNSPFKPSASPYQFSLLNSTQDAINCSKNTYLRDGYDFYGRSGLKDWNNFNFIRPSINPSPTFGINGSNEHQKTANKMWESLAGNSYAGLCYKPLQAKDLKIFFSTGRFPSTDSYIRVPSGFPTLEDTKGHEKRSYSPESMLRRAAMTYQNTPSIIRKPRLPKHNSNVQKHIGEGNIHGSIEDFASPQKTRKVENSFAVNSVGKSLKDAFDMVWNLRK